MAQTLRPNTILFGNNWFVVRYLPLPPKGPLGLKNGGNSSGREPPVPRRCLPLDTSKGVNLFCPEVVALVDALTLVHTPLVRTLVLPPFEAVENAIASA